MPIAEPISVRSDLPDGRIAHAFQKTSFPAEYIGDLYALIAQVTTPLAVRSSSLLEDYRRSDGARRAQSTSFRGL